MGDAERVQRMRMEKGKGSNWKQQKWRGKRGDCQKNSISIGSSLNTLAASIVLKLLLNLLNLLIFQNVEILEKVN